MGRSKSPGKWIKTLLFGKKTRSSLSKRREISKAANEKDARAAKAPTANLDVDPPLNSRPELDTIDSNGEKSVGAASNIPCEGVVVLQGNHDANKLETTVSGVANDAERIRQEQAATKAQAAFRGYLARRAFRALKGIIRLQALVRGHLVRRQAIATIHCMHGIVKLQALVRGRRVRHSDIGLEVQKNCCSGKLLDAKYLESFKVTVSTWTEKLPTNAFVSKLLASSPIAMPLRLQYGPGEPNSAWNWLERWTSFHFWQPLPQPKKIVDSKSQTRQGHLRTEPGRPKRSVRRLSTANVDNGSIPLISESEKPKRNPKKVLSHPIDTVHEHPQNELEKVKRNMRKISSSTIEASDRGEVETEKPKHSLRKTTSSAAPDISDPSMSDWAEKTKTDTTVAVPKKPEIAVAKQPQTTPEDGPVDALQSNHHPAVELLPSESGGNHENIPPTNGELSPKEDQTSNGNLKTSRRRASFPAKPEEPENGVQNNPTLPSYMAATASAKAKLRGQGSPRFGQDEAEKNGFTRRHSLPSSTNGKLSSLSLRTQVLVQASGKGGIRSDKSLLSSKDGKEKVIQADWKR